MNWKKYLPGIGLFFLALLVRIPWLWEVPRYIDELREVNLGYLIYKGAVFPLHNVSGEIGALHNYILAGIFQVFGANIYWPRLYVAITSACTVLLVYFLGKRLYNHWTGIIAAGLLLTNGMHILVTHMAWANCTTPFFFTLALIAIVKAEEEKNGKWLVASGFFWALTLQTHSSVIVYIPAVLLYILILRFGEFKKIPFRYHVYGVIVFIAGYANMIIFNIISRGESIRWISTKGYTLESNPGLVSFGNNLSGMWFQLIRTLSSTYANQESLWSYFIYPFFSIAAFLLGFGIYRSIKEKKTLLLLIIAGGFLVIPWINHRYEFFVVTRYIMPVIIAALIIMAYGISVLLTKFLQSENKLKYGLGVLFLVVIGMQLVPFYSYCSRLAETNLSNTLSLRLVNTVKQVNQSKAMVLVDPEIKITNNPIPTLLRICSIDSRKILSLERHNFKRKDIEPGYAILTPATFQSLERKIGLKKLKVFERKSLIPNSKPDSIQPVYLVKITSW